MKQATHTGECQICGRRQMLPDGVLAKHGYTTKWGFFSGVCAGAGHLPFEQSMDQIAAAVERVKDDVAATSSEIALYEDLTSPYSQLPTAWVSIYDGTEYRNVKATITLGDPKAYDHGTNYYATYTTVDQVWCWKSKSMKQLSGSVQAYERSWSMPTLAHWVCFLNTAYSKRTLRPLNASRHNWLLWQAARTKDWTPKPLTARKGGAK